MPCSPQPTNLYCGPERGKVTLPSSKVTRAEKGQMKRVEGGRRKEAIMSPACLSTKDALRARLPDVFLRPPSACLPGAVLGL